MHPRDQLRIKLGSTVTTMTDFLRGIAGNAPPGPTISLNYHVKHSIIRVGETYILGLLRI